MRRTASEAEQTRTNILAAAMRLFGEKGFDLTNLDEIASEANVTRGAIYHHFKDKFSLFIQLVGDAFSGYRSIIREALEQDLSPIEALQEMMLKLFSQDIQTQAMSRVMITQMMVYTQDPEHDDQVRTIVGRFISEMDQELVHLITAGQSAGEFRTDMQAEDIVLTLKSYIKGMTHLPREQSKIEFDPASAGLYADVILRGIRS